MDHLRSSGETPNPSGFPLNARLGFLGATSLMLNRAVDGPKEKNHQKKQKKKEPKKVFPFFRFSIFCFARVFVWVTKRRGRGRLSLNVPRCLF